jgi:hypothetical protein
LLRNLQHVLRAVKMNHKKSEPSPQAEKNTVKSLLPQSSQKKIQVLPTNPEHLEDFNEVLKRAASSDQAKDQT